MTNGGTDLGRFPQAARILEERFKEVFADYERRLTEIGSLMVLGEGNTNEQLKANAHSVLSRAVESARAWTSTEP